MANETIPISIKDLDNYPGAIPAEALVFIGAVDGKLYKGTVQQLLTALGVPSHNQAISTITGLQAALDDLNQRVTALEP